MIRLGTSVALAVTLCACGGGDHGADATPDAPADGATLDVASDAAADSTAPGDTGVPPDTGTLRDSGPPSDAPSGPYCGAAAGAHCYYVDARNGSDANDGSLAHPWQTYLNVVSYYGTDPGSTPAPAGQVDLAPGDAVYFMDGTYTATYQYDGTSQGFFVRGIHGTADKPITLAAYPGQHPVFSAPGVVAIGILQSSYWAIDGVEVANATQAGIDVEETDHVSIHAVTVHDTDGVDNNNIAGLYLSDATYVEVWESEFYDNYDRTDADTGGMPTENSMNVVLFNGGFVNFHDNHIFNSPATSNGRHGGGIKYKHMATVAGGTFVVAHNRIEDCQFTSIGTGSPDSTIVGNLVRNSAPILLHDFGGPTQLSNITISYNTLIDTGLNVEPEESGAPATAIRFDHNVVVDHAAAYTTENALVDIGAYESDAEYAYVTSNGVIAFSSNCYFNPMTPPAYNFFGSGSATTQGGLYTFAEWQSHGYDTDSYVEDPALSVDIATSQHCSALGFNRAP